MDIYIDKANLVSLIKSRENPLFDDCSKLLKKQLNIFFNFSKNELKGNDLIRTWITTFTSGMGNNNSIEFDYLIPNRPLKSTTSNELCKKGLSSIYLLDDPDIDKLKNAGTVLIGKLGEEIETLNNLFLFQNDYLFEKKWKIGSQKFQAWLDLKEFSLPVTDIIIIDPYVVSDESLCLSNLRELLKSLAFKSKSKINVVIYTNKANCIDYSIISPIVRNAIRSVTDVSPKFTLITYQDQRGISSRSEHDRTVLMNYFRIYSGDTLNYFDGHGKTISKGREIIYSSLAKEENFNLSRELLKDLQQNIDFFKKNSGIEGDKKSNYLDFS